MVRTGAKNETEQATRGCAGRWHLEGSLGQDQRHLRRGGTVLGSDRSLGCGDLELSRQLLLNA